MRKQTQQFNPELIYLKLKALNDKIEKDIRTRKALDILFSIADDKEINK